VARAADRARAGIRWAPWSAQAHRFLGEAELAAGDRDSSIESFRRAVDADRRDWELWFVLAQVAKGAERDRALEEARRLNPESPEIQAYLLEVGKP
jgi:Flp pilus assembly protein TadD